MYILTPHCEEGEEEEKPPTDTQSPACLSIPLTFHERILIHLLLHVHVPLSNCPGAEKRKKGTNDVFIPPFEAANETKKKILENVDLRIHVTLQCNVHMCLCVCTHMCVGFACAIQIY